MLFRSVTASQLNRGAVDEVEFDHSHISGGISKINTADNVFGIFTSRTMRERGRYQIQLMKTRSSSGVGQKIDLDFNIETLRITDPCEEDQMSQNFDTSSVKENSTLSIMEKIKTASKISPLSSSDDIKDEKKISANVNSSKLAHMLQQLKTKEN